MNFFLHTPIVASYDQGVCININSPNYQDAFSLSPSLLNKTITHLTEIFLLIKKRTSALSSTEHSFLWSDYLSLEGKKDAHL